MQHLSPEMITKLRQLLEAQKEKLLLSKQRTEEENPANDAERVNDNGSPDADASEEVMMIHSEVMGTQIDESLARIEAALRRMQDGTYGLDVDGQPIPVERLLADPTVTTQVSK